MPIAARHGQESPQEKATPLGKVRGLQDAVEAQQRKREYLGLAVSLYHLDAGGGGTAMGDSPDTGSLTGDNFETPGGASSLRRAA